MAEGDRRSEAPPKGHDTNAQLGARLRELRSERGLKQGAVARMLRISPAYLSLIEQGKRVMQLPLLLRALEIYEVPLEEFAAPPSEADPLAAFASDPLFRGLDLQLGPDLSQEHAAAFAKVFEEYRRSRRHLDQLLDELSSDEARKEPAKLDTDETTVRFDAGPLEEVTEYVERQGNFFPELEQAATQLREDAQLRPVPRFEDLLALLHDRFGVHVEESDDAGVVQRFDKDQGQLTLTTHATETRRRFALARTIALQIFGDTKIEEPLLERIQGGHPETRRLVRRHLASYFAGALLLPYGAMLDELERTRYDIERVSELFNASYESIAHRVCTLRDPARPSVPMHFLRVDIAGNITKRYAGDGSPQPKRGGGCPLSVAHLAFLAPNTISRQYVVYPDGRTYFTFAKVVGERRGGRVARGTLYSIGLGCRSDDAEKLAYADDMPFVDPPRMAVPVGPSCRLCDRLACPMRSAPSYERAFEVRDDIAMGNFFAPADED